MGFATAIIQLGIAAIPWGIFRDWSIFLVTSSGILLAFITGSTGQWAREKWHARTNSPGTYILTRGVGHQHAIVIISGGVGLNLEDLASSSNFDAYITSRTRITMIILAALWTFHLITATGIKQNTWFLLAIGGIGILNNTFVANSKRHPEAFGIPLTFTEVIGETSVMKTLLQVEERYPNVGRAMLKFFFPGKLRPKEEEEWKALGYKVPE
jgi:hypothetical protein